MNKVYNVCSRSMRLHLGDAYVEFYFASNYRFVTCPTCLRAIQRTRTLYTYLTCQP